MNFNHGIEPGDTLGMLRKLKNVQRLSGKYLIQKYSVAEHCYYTGILFEHFAKLEDINITLIETDFVYRHDMLEAITGDIQRPAKTHNKTINKCWETIEEQLSFEFGIVRYLDSFADIHFSKVPLKLFKACDLLELYLFCHEEYNLGNQSKDILTVLNNCFDNLIVSDFSSIADYVSGTAQWR